MAEEGEIVNKVEPIADKNLINEIAEDLKQENCRDYILFLFGVCCGPRISEMICLRIIDVKNKESVRIKATKNNKTLEVPIPKMLQKELKDYCKGKDVSDYLPERAWDQ